MEGQPHLLPYRCPLKTLQKCEIALEKLKNDMAVVRGVPWPGGIGRVAGISGEVRAHPTVTRNHELEGACSQRWAGDHAAQSGDPAQESSSRSGLQCGWGENMGEISLWVWAHGCFLPPQV